ncbi:N-formylglutamate amidohydrolase [Nioella aestuarii]|uniref:N-formylglutamate amidohydrolase n=1 Tax=Nioella aestuarii TaxID=1662864 RepID=UPI003D7FCF61
MSVALDMTANEAVEVINRRGTGPVVLLCEHASHHIPARYDGLGLAPKDRLSHAAWDPGALGVARELSRLLDAPLVASRTSRLVYDCNRPPEAASAMPVRSEAIDVPGNHDLSPEQRSEREATVYRPFCDAVAAVLDARRVSQSPTALVTVHSFTPVFHGHTRSVEIGVLHDTDRRIADVMLERAATLTHRQVNRNDPYGPADGVTHSLRLHGVERDLPNVMIEIRNDLLMTEADQAVLAQEIHQLLVPALIALGLVNQEAGNA